MPEDRAGEREGGRVVHCSVFCTPLYHQKLACGAGYHTGQVGRPEYYCQKIGKIWKTGSKFEDPAIKVQLTFVSRTTDTLKGPPSQC